MKIQIIGYSGAGKSTLSIRLAKFYEIPCLHLDNVQYYGDWKERSRQEQHDIVTKFLIDNDSWVIDGNYSHVAPDRFAQSDLTIFLDYNRCYCYVKCLFRYLSNRGRNRSSCPCIEKFDWEFQRWIIKDGRTKSHRIRHYEHLNQTTGQKLTFKNVHQLNRWLIKLGNE